VPAQEGGRVGGWLLHQALCAKQRGSSAGVKVRGPQLNHGREVLASFRWKMGASGFGWVRVSGREGSGGSPTSSFHQRQVLPRLLIRNHVPVTCGLRCLEKGSGTVNRVTLGPHGSWCSQLSSA